MDTRYGSNDTIHKSSLGGKQWTRLDYSSKHVITKNEKYVIMVGDIGQEGTI